MQQQKSCATHASTMFIAVGAISGWMSMPAVAGTPSTCESLTSFSFPDTTINYALSQPGGPNDMATVDQVLAADLNATSTDLRPFAGRGGKLVMYHGFADPLIPSQSSINYFSALVETTVSGHSARSLERTQQFARLFMPPGM